jgi:PAS domain S-box-containing protein
MLIMCPETRAALEACRQARLRPRLSARRLAEPSPLPAPPPRPQPEQPASAPAVNLHDARLHDPRSPEQRPFQRALELGRIQAEAAEERRERQRLQDQLDSVLSVLQDAVLVVGRDGLIGTENRAAQRLFGASLVGRPLSALIASPDSDRVTRLVHAGGRTSDAIEVTARTGARRAFPARLHARSLTAADRGAFVCVVRDLSEREALQREVLDAAEHEKRAIGQELHDSIGQQLTGLRFYAEMLAQSLGAKALPEAEQADKLRRILEAVGHQVRELSHGLMPVIADGGGLPRALGQLAADLDYLDTFTCEFTCTDPTVTARLSGSDATQLYRIAQEATQNAIRHSQGDKIRISLGLTGAAIVLEIADNGAGIAEDKLQQPSGGIRIMQHRAAILGACLRIINNDESGGTAVQCRLGTELKGSD